MELWSKTSRATLIPQRATEEGQHKQKLIHLLSHTTRKTLLSFYWYGCTLHDWLSCSSAYMSWIPLQSACYPKSYKNLKHSRKMNPESPIPKVSATRWSFQLLVLGKNGRDSDLQGQLSNSPITERQNLYSSTLLRGCSGNKFLGKRSLFFFLVALFCCLLD